VAGSQVHPGLGTAGTRPERPATYFVGWRRRTSTTMSAAAQPTSCGRSRFGCWPRTPGTARCRSCMPPSRHPRQQLRRAQPLRAHARRPGTRRPARPAGYALALDVQGHDYVYPGATDTSGNEISMAAALTGCGPFIHRDPADQVTARRAMVITAGSAPAFAPTCVQRPRSRSSRLDRPTPVSARHAVPHAARLASRSTSGIRT
jgi:hypothetical protein